MIVFGEPDHAGASQMLIEYFLGTPVWIRRVHISVMTKVLNMKEQH